MSSDASPDTPIVRALKEKEAIQKELREAAEAVEKIDAFIKAHKELPAAIAQATEAQVTPLIRQRQELERKLQPFMHRLGQLDQFLATYRSLAGPFDPDALTAEQATLSRGGRGMTQPLFARLAVMVLRDVNRPMQSGEFVDEFRKRGHEIGGTNETKTAWNRLWEAKRDGILTHIPALGYWLPGEELPVGAEEAALAARAERRKEGRGKGRRLGRPKTTRRGRRPILTDAQVKTAEQWLAAGTKTIAEICRDLGGISSPTLFNYIPGGRKAAREKYPELAAEADARPKVPSLRKSVVRKMGDKKLGRPPVIAGDKAELAESLFLKGGSMKDIALALDVNLASVYRYFGLKNREYWEKRRDEAQAQARNRRR